MPFRSTSHRFDVFGATLSEKAFMYASGVMLAMSDGQASMLEAVCGLFAGYVISCGVGSESDVFVAPALGRADDDDSVYVS